MKFFATTFSGMEDVAAAEVLELLGVSPEIDVGKIVFEGSLDECVKLNFAGQTVNRVYLLLLRERVSGLGDVEKAAASVDYASVIGREQSFAVRAERIGVHSFTSLEVAARVGKAVIDSYKAATGVRLRVDLNNPDVELYAILRDDELLLGVNTSGESLHRRWYRTGFHRAALSPTVANAMVRVSGWNPDECLVDPFCGSGTIPLEAAVYGLNISPGLRKRLVLEKLVFIDAEAVEKVRRELVKRERVGEVLNVLGFDVSPRWIDVAESSRLVSGLGDAVRFGVADVMRLAEVLTTDVDKVVCNPPFGLRIRLKEPEKFYIDAFKSIRHACPHASLTIIVNKPITATKALEAAGYSVVSSRKVLLGPLSVYILSAV